MRDEKKAAARHEAAHAVVAVRLGLPLESTTIEPDHGESHSGTVTLADGRTMLAEGTLRRWQEALPDPAAVANLKAFAVQSTAGMVAEGWPEVDIDTDVGAHDDFHGMLHLAGVLGIGASSSDPAVPKFVADAIRLAREILTQDSGAAWDRVSVALLRKTRLSGDEVRAIVERQQEGRAV